MDRRVRAVQRHADQRDLLQVLHRGLVPCPAERELLRRRRVERLVPATREARAGTIGSDPLEVRIPDFE